jgi:hypothetical protein
VFGASAHLPEFSTGWQAEDMSRPAFPSLGDPNVAWSRSSDSSSERFALGLTRADVDEFRALIHRECDESLSLEEAWKRATEVLTLFRMLLGPLPEDQASPAYPQTQVLTASREAGITE